MLADLTADIRPRLNYIQASFLSTVQLLLYHHEEPGSVTTHADFVLRRGLSGKLCHG